MSVNESERQLFNLGITGLEQYAETNWGFIGALEAVEAELSHRKTKRARELSTRIGKRLRELKHAGKAEKHGGTGGTDEDRLRKALDEARALAATLEVKNQDLERKLGEAEREMARLRAGPSESGTAGLYARVGLHPGAPSFVVAAVRRAFRKHFHPDGRANAPDDEKKQAEETLKRFETIFDRLESLR